MALTKVSGGILDPGINVAGIVTATGFDGPFIGGSSKNIVAGIITATGLDVNGNGDISGLLTAGSANFTGNVSIGGTLTYEDVKNVDSVGIITARKNILVGGANPIVGTPYNYFYGRGSGASGVSIYAAEAALELVGSNSGSHGASLLFRTAGNDGIGFNYNTGNNTLELKSFDATNNNFQIHASGNNVSNLKDIFKAVSGGAAELYHNGSKKFETTTNGIDITGSSTFAQLKLKTSDGSNRGGLYAASNNALYLLDSQDHQFMHLVKDGEVIIKHDNSNILRTWTSGVEIFGALYATSVDLNDNQKILLGTGDDLELYHNGSNSIIKNNTGELEIRGSVVKILGNTGAEASVFTRSGSVELTHNGVKKFETTNVGAKVTHSGAPTRIVIGSTDASGAWLVLDGDSNGDGAGSDYAYIEHNSSGHLNLINPVGGVALKGGGVNSVVCQEDAEVVLYHNGNRKFETTNTGATVTGTLIADGLTVYDNEKLTLGNNTDIEIFHNGTNSIFQSDTGDLQINAGNSAGNVEINVNNNVAGNTRETSAKFIKNGAVELYYDNVKKLATTSEGCQITSTHGSFLEIRTSGAYDPVLMLTANNNDSTDWTIRNDESDSNKLDFRYNGTRKVHLTSSGDLHLTGEVATSQDYPDSKPTLDLNFAATKKLDPRITFQRTGLASFVNEFGKIVLIGGNEPRFDHDPITRESKGLLIEESRTNLLKYSVDFASIGGYNANYSAARSTLTSTTELAPDGTNTASKYVRTAGQGTGEVAIIVNPIGTSVGTVYTTSVFVKNFGTNSTVELVNVRATSVHDDSQFNLANGTIITEGSDISLTTITPYPNDWYRISVTATANNAGYFWVRIYSQPEGSGFILWGGQVEAGSFPSSYIPTDNNASVARGADLVEITEEEFSEFYNQTEGSFVSEIMLPSSWPMSSYGSYMMTLSDGSYNNRITLASSTGSAQFNADINIGSNNPTRANLGSYTSGSHSIKAAMAYKISDSAGSLNGAAAVTSSPSGTLPLLTRADIGKDHANYNLLNGHMKRLMYYSHRIPNNQLRTLTS